jgi:hypothetical protein
VRYFDLLTNMRLPGRWILEDPVDEDGHELDPWQFEKGRRIDLRGTMRCSLAHPGHALDFSFSVLNEAASRQPVVAQR